MNYRILPLIKGAVVITAPEKDQFLFAYLLLINFSSHY